MRVKFYAHASFRLEGDNLTVITDPYRPSVAKYEPINEPADIVVMSSHNDLYHCDPTHITGAPVIVNALALDPAGETRKGLHIKPYPVMENTYGTHRPRNPDDNAMYTFSLGGIRVLHMGDIGHAVLDEQLQALRRKVDLMLCLTGDKYTLPLADLDDAIRTIQPKVVIPMHYNNDRCPLEVLPVTEFTKRYPKEQVRWIKGSTIEINKSQLTQDLQIIVLDESR